MARCGRVALPTRLGRLFTPTPDGQPKRNEPRFLASRRAARSRNTRFDLIDRFCSPFEQRHDGRGAPKRSMDETKEKRSSLTNSRHSGHRDDARRHKRAPEPTGATPSEARNDLARCFPPLKFPHSMLLTDEQAAALSARAERAVAEPPSSPPSSPPKSGTQWIDSHGVHHSRASGRGKKGDDAFAIAHADDRPVYALDRGDPNCDDD